MFRVLTIFFQIFEQNFEFMWVWNVKNDEKRAKIKKVLVLGGLKKWAKMAKNHIVFGKMRFRNFWGVLSGPNYIFGKFGAFLKNKKIFELFLPWLGHFLQRFWTFLPPNGLKMVKCEPSLVYGEPWKPKIWENNGFWRLWWF